eukprot:GHVL01037364.1.p1 GENE.GHVL01037364.1~~GHVL01037364.1.p1  ORF type:complete len:990 (-),score=85.46 GHVL01037364.1:2688-5657(-)
MLVYKKEEDVEHASQRPKYLNVESSEEVRTQMVDILICVLNMMSSETLRIYIHTVISLITVTCMDSVSQIKVKGCNIVRSICSCHKELLFYWTEPLMNGLTSCLTHQHSKLRIIAWDAVTAVLLCGTWKFTLDSIHLLIGYFDPNVASIKSFYESDTHFNYMAHALQDSSPKARKHFYETVCYWLLQLPDKRDIENRIFPYLLSGLFDKNYDLQIYVYNLLNECGLAFERERESDLREQLQLGFKSSWTYDERIKIVFPLGGKWKGFVSADKFETIKINGRNDSINETDIDIASATDDNSSLPTPSFWMSRNLKNPLFHEGIPMRPRLGARSWVKILLRKFIKCLLHEVVDFRECSTEVSARLLVVSIAFTEESVTEWLHDILTLMIKIWQPTVLSKDGVLTVTNFQPRSVMASYETLMKLLGVYLEPNSWEESIVVEMVKRGCQAETSQRYVCLHLLALIIEGAAECLESLKEADLGLGRLSHVLPRVMNIISMSELFEGNIDSPWRMSILTLLASLTHPVLVHHYTKQQMSQILAIGYLSYSDDKSANSLFNMEPFASPLCASDCIQQLRLRFNVQSPSIEMLSLTENNFYALRSFINVLTTAELKESLPQFMKSIAVFVSINHLESIRMDCVSLLLKLAHNFAYEGPENSSTIDKLLYLLSAIIRIETPPKLLIFALVGVRNFFIDCHTVTAPSLLITIANIASSSNLSALFYGKSFNAQCKESNKQGTSGVVPMKTRRALKNEALLISTKIRMEAAMTLYFGLRIKNYWSDVYDTEKIVNSIIRIFISWPDQIRLNMVLQDQLTENSIPQIPNFPVPPSSPGISIIAAKSLYLCFFDDLQGHSRWDVILDGVKEAEDHHRIFRPTYKSSKTTIIRWLTKYMLDLNMGCARPSDDSDVYGSLCLKSNKDSERHHLEVSQMIEDSVAIDVERGFDNNSPNVKDSYCILFNLQRDLCKHWPDEFDLFMEHCTKKQHLNRVQLLKSIRT